MSKTNRAAKPGAKTAAALAKSFVDARLRPLADYLDCIDPGDTDDQHDEIRKRWKTVVRAARLEEEATFTDAAYAAYVALDVHADLLWQTEVAHARAGFLVGLEMGRRIGGGVL